MIFYKYSSVENAQQIVTKSYLKITNPQYFNDPFDCQLPTLEYNFKNVYTQLKKKKGIFHKKIL
jgi:hypothetical protein